MQFRRSINQYEIYIILMFGKHITVNKIKNKAGFMQEGTEYITSKYCVYSRCFDIAQVVDLHHIKR
jgi:hypothetical protein